MIKEKLFKFLFPSEHSELGLIRASLGYHTTLVGELMEKNEKLIKDYENKELGDKELMQYCLKTLNVPYIDFSNVDNDGKPPHYLDNLTDDERKNFIAHMETIYADEKFQTVVSYVINLIGNHAIQKADDDKMKNGKIGIIGVRTLMTEFINAHQEFVDSKKPVEGFDELAIMPE